MPARGLPRHMRTGRRSGIPVFSARKRNDWWVCAVHFYDGVSATLLSVGLCTEITWCRFICINVAERKQKTAVICAFRLHRFPRQKPCWLKRLLKHTQRPANLYSCVQNLKWTNPFWRGEINQRLSVTQAFHSAAVSPQESPRHITFFRWILQRENVSMSKHDRWLFCQIPLNCICIPSVVLKNEGGNISNLDTANIKYDICTGAWSHNKRCLGQFCHFDIKSAGLHFIVWLFARCGIFQLLCACMTPRVYTGWLNVGFSGHWRKSWFACGLS